MKTGLYYHIVKLDGVLDNLACFFVDEIGGEICIFYFFIACSSQLWRSRVCLNTLEKIALKN